jgi:hypothetical protein
MAGGRVQSVRIVNRTTGPLDCMFDGVPDVVPAGYRLVPGQVPKLDARGVPVTRKGEGGLVEPVMVDGTMVVGAGDKGEPLFHVVEKAAAEAYVRQHPIMGTADPSSVDAKDTDYLLGVIEWGDEISHIEQSDEIELLNRSLLPEDRQNVKSVRIAGGRREVATGAVLHDRKVRANKRKAAMGAGFSANPFGIRAAHE